MLHRPGTVVHEVDLRLVCPGEDGVLLSATLRYEPSDPYAVEATFRAAEESISWVLGRDLLAEGLVSESGDGDVHVWPTLEDDLAVVMIRLSSPDGQALLAAAASDVQDFLRRTFQAVPSGTEQSLLDIDTTIEQLLAS